VQKKSYRRETSRSILSRTRRRGELKKAKIAEHHRQGRRDRSIDRGTQKHGGKCERLWRLAQTASAANQTVGGKKKSLEERPGKDASFSIAKAQIRKTEENGVGKSPNPQRSSRRTEKVKKEKERSVIAHRRAAYPVSLKGKEKEEKVQRTGNTNS